MLGSASLLGWRRIRTRWHRYKFLSCGIPLLFSIGAGLHRSVTLPTCQITQTARLQPTHVRSRR